jgi:hypothetical protein
MRITLKILGLITIVATAAITFIYGRGPVGPESVVGREVEERIVKAAARADASVSAATSANPDLLELPPALEQKRRVKRILSKIGIVYPAPENAMQFTLRQQHVPQSVRCLVVLRGDHVIGIAVIYDGGDGPFADRVEAALGMEFPGYDVQRLRPSA